MIIQSIPLPDWLDTTYFRASQCKPRVYDDQITIINGHGSSRGWGKPGVESTVVFRGRGPKALIAIHVGFFHKHQGGQGWYYYLNSEGWGWHRATWNQLSDTQRRKVLKKFKAGKAPSWANCPGDLRTETKKRLTTPFTTYKIVARDHHYTGDFVSLYDHHTIYELGVTKKQAAKYPHEGGYYSYRDLDRLRAVWQSGQVVAQWHVDWWHERRGAEFVILECECWGKTIDYGSKIATTYLKPVREIEVLPYPH